MSVKDGMIVDGPHYAAGYSLNAPHRTNADGEVWAFPDKAAAVENYRANLTYAEGTYSGQELAEYLDGFSLDYHDRPVSECRDCVHYSANGIPVEVFDPHWSVINRDGMRQWIDSEWYMGHLIAIREAFDPVKHDTYDSCDCEED